MFQDTQQGQFWFSDKPEHPVAGTLSIQDRGRLRLTTTAVENSSFDGFLEFFKTYDTPRTICGTTPSGYVTLVEARSSGKKTQFNPYLTESQHTWDCSYALRSQSYEPTPLEKEITSIEVHIQFLPGWAQDGHNLQLDWKNRTLSWPTKWDCQTSKWSLGEVGLQYSSRISGPDPEGRWHRFEISVDASLIARFDQPQSPDAVLDTVSSLQSLVTIAMGEPASIEKILLTVVKGATEHKVLFHYSPTLWPVDPAPKSSELFTFSQIRGVKGIASWLDSLRDQPHVINGLLIDRFHRPAFVTDTTLHRLLACEAYQRKLDNTTRGRIKLEDTLPRLNAAEPEFLGWIGNWKTWRATIAQIRSDLIAHLQSYGKPYNDILTVATVNEQLYAYLVARILAQCNFPNELIKDVIARASSEAVMHLPHNDKGTASSPKDRLTKND